MKKIYSIIISLVICCFVLIGCGKAEVSTDVKVNKNGSTESIIKVAYDDIVKAVVKNDLLKKLVGDKYGEINKYSENGLNVEEVTLTTEKIKFMDMINTFKNLDTNKVEAAEINDLDKYINLLVDKKLGILFNTYTVKVNLKKDLVKEAVDGTDAFEKISPDLSELLSNGIGSYIGNIPYTLKLNLPFEIIDSNGTVLDKNTVEWDWNLKDLNPNTFMIVSIKVINILSVTIFSIIVIIIVITSVIYLKKKRR